MKKILLTFDVEEFDLPREFGQKISDKETFEISRIGLENLISLLDKHYIKATFFTTANFAMRHPLLIKNLSQEGHEIACHGYCHSDCYTKGTSKTPLAKKEIEKIIGKKIKGFRTPRFEINDISKLSEFEFDYDSSSHPIYLPGRYFNINKKRKLHQIGALIEVPLSTLPPNFSIFWLAFKNFPLVYSKIFTRINFFTTDYTMSVMHPWEFTDISKFKLPWYVNKIYGEKLLAKLEKYILFCKKKNWEFDTVEGFLGL